MSPDLFPEAPRHRAKPRKLGHVIDAGHGCGLDDDGSRNHWARLKCVWCDHQWEIHSGHTITELKRGLPCPECNGEPV